LIICYKKLVVLILAVTDFVRVNINRGQELNKFFGNSKAVQSFFFDLGKQMLLCVVFSVAKDKSDTISFS
jgi:hypothetical protein